MNITFREITPEDNEILASIIRYNLKKHDLAIPGTVYFDPELDRLSDFYLADPSNRKYWILQNDDGTVLGGIGLARFEHLDNCAELQKLYLIDEVKGRGLGKLMVKKILSTAVEMGFERMYLETHSNLQIAIQTYEKCGFQYIDRPEFVVHSTMDTFMVKEFI